MNNKTKTIISLLLVVMAYMIVVEVITGLIAAPTGEHKEAARQLILLDPSNQSELTNLQKIQQTPAGQHYTQMSGLVGLAGIILSIPLIYYVYKAIRTRQLFRRYVTATASIFTIGVLLAIPLQVLFTSLYFSLPFKESVTLSSAFAYVGSGLVTFVLVLLVAWVAESRYNMKHSFEIE